MDILSKIKNIILDILFPSICLNCRSGLTGQEKDGKICQKCLNSIRIYSSFFCPKCRSRVPGEEKQCHKEIKFLLAPATDYQNQAVKNLVWFLKYHRWQSIINILEPIINNYLDILNCDLKNFTVIPIPLHPDRLKERGFNQSELLAGTISEKTGAVLDKNNLKRIKSTKNQAELKNIDERVENIKNCFALNDPKEIENKNIVLVDDVFTTGSTMSEAVKILKTAGAKKIIAFVFAKA
jgi:ComF family protein